ncbi:MAG: hypothetical protein JXB36_03390 [Gammaproteobacteria bacterium]|nr:hypothetical protein [Gammaproteobacteria bacterium]
MKERMPRGIAALGAALALFALSAAAHHGSSISYDVQNLWTTWATVTQFNYANPHPTMTFDRIVGDGEVEHWVAELLTNPSTMARQGWTRKRTLDALAPGTRVKLTLGTSRAGGFSGIVMRIENESGEAIAGGFGGPGAPDLDGVPGGRQPQGDELLPGQEPSR